MTDAAEPAEAGQPSAADEASPAAAEDPLASALEAIARVERHLGLTLRSADYQVHNRVVRRTDAGADDGLDLHRLADPYARRPLPGSAAVRSLDSAGVVHVVGKHTRSDQIKARSYVADGNRPVTVKTWTGGSDGQPNPLGARERQVRTEIAAIPEYQAPAVLGHGRVDATDYLVESMVFGRHPLEAAERAAAATAVGASLAGAYTRYGLEDRPLDEVVNKFFGYRVIARLSDPALPWDPAWGSREQVLAGVNRLVERNRTLPCTLCHGDLVSTNIIVTESGGHVLTDWEHGRVLPVAVDLCKLLLTSGDPTGVAARLEPALRPFAGRGLRRYRWREQLALALSQNLSWSARRREQAVAAGRLDQFEREQAGQIALLSELLV